MENNTLKKEIDQGKVDLSEYVNARFDLFRLNLAENFSKAVSALLIISVMMFVLSIIFIFFSFGVASWISNIYEYPSLGYFVVAGFYLILILIFWIFRRKLIHKPIIKFMIEVFFPSEPNIDHKDEK